MPASRIPRLNPFHMKHLLKKTAPLILAALLFVGTPVHAAFTDTTWNIKLGTWLEPANVNGLDVLIKGVNHYLNFGTFNGSSGYGFRDNNGVIEFKNSGGVWAGIGSGSGGGGSAAGTFSTTTSNVAGEFVNYSNNNTDIVAVGGTSTTTASFFFDPNALFAKIGGQLLITGSSTLQNFTARNSTSTSATSTNFFTVNDTSTTASTSNFFGANLAACTGSTFLHWDVTGKFSCGTPTDTTASSTLLSDNNGFSGANSFSQTITGAITGNAGSATILQNTRTINGVSFNGSANIVVASTTLLADNNAFTGLNTFTDLKLVTRSTTTDATTTNSFFLGTGTNTQDGLTVNLASTSRSPFSVYSDNLTVPFVNVSSVDRFTINGASAFVVPQAMTTLEHNFANIFDPLDATGFQSSYPLLLQNTSSLNGSSTGIGFAVTSTNASNGAGIIFTRTGANTMGKLDFMVHTDAVAQSPLTDVLTLTDTGVASTTKFTAITGTTTNATSTNFFATTASTSALFGANLSTCNGASSALTYTGTTGLFGCNTISSSGSPGGATGNIQFNDFGIFGGHSYFSLSTTTTNMNLLVGLPNSTQNLGTIQLSYSGNVSDARIILTPAGGTSGNKTITIPNLTDTLAVIGTNNLFSAQQTFSNANSILANGSTTLQNFTALNSTSTNATTTSLAATTICFTGDTCRTTWPSGGSSASSTLLTDNNGFSGLNTFTDLKLVTRSTTTNATTTNLFSTTASSTNLFTTNLGVGSSTLQAPVVFAQTGGLLNPDLIIDGVQNGVGAEMELNRANTSGTEANIDFNTAGVEEWQVGIQNNNTDNFEIWDGADDPYFTINKLNGDIGIGTSTPYSELTLWGDSTGADKSFEITDSASTTTFSVRNNGLTSLINLLATGSSTLQNFTARNATTSQATTTNFAIANIATGNCLQTTTGGAVIGSGSACGSGSGGLPYPFPLAGNATSSTVGFNLGLIGTGSSTIANLSVTTATATSATTTNLAITSTLSKLLLTDSNGVVSGYAAQACTNQFVRGLSALGVPTCNSVSISADVSGLATGIATFLGAPSSANLASALTDKTGTGVNVFNASPTFTGTTNFASFIASASSTIGGGTTGSGLTIFGGATTTGQSLHLASTTLQNFTFVNATGTSATTTNFFATLFNAITASTTNFQTVNSTTTSATTTTQYISGTLAIATTTPMGNTLGSLSIGAPAGNGCLLCIGSTTSNGGPGLVSALFYKPYASMAFGTGTLAVAPSAEFSLNASTTAGVSLFPMGLFDLGSSTATKTVSLFNIAFSGQQISSTTVPIISSCGTSPTFYGDDSAMSVTVGATATACTATFGTPYVKTPSCNVTNRSMSITSAMSYTVSKTAVVVSQAVGFGADIIDIICKQTGNGS